jgi:hypothetical protein
MRITEIKYSNIFLYKGVKQISWHIFESLSTNFSVDAVVRKLVAWSFSDPVPNIDVCGNYMWKRRNVLGQYWTKGNACAAPSLSLTTLLTGFSVTRERDAQSFATVYHLPRATARKWGPNFARSIQGETERTQNQYYWDSLHYWQG